MRPRSLTPEDKADFEPAIIPPDQSSDTAPKARLSNLSPF